MKVAQISYNPATGWTNVASACSEHALVLTFAEGSFGNPKKVRQDLGQETVAAMFLACSTAPVARRSKPASAFHNHSMTVTRFYEG